MIYRLDTNGPAEETVISEDMAGTEIARRTELAANAIRSHVQAVAREGPFRRCVLSMRVRARAQDCEAESASSTRHCCTMLSSVTDT